VGMEECACEEQSGTSERRAKKSQGGVAGSPEGQTDFVGEQTQFRVFLLLLDSVSAKAHRITVYTY